MRRMNGSSPFGERESPASWTGRGQSICQVRAFCLSTEVGIVLAMRKAYLSGQSGACVSLKYRSCERSNSISDSELELLGESKFRLAPALNILLAIVCKLNSIVLTRLLMHNHNETKLELTARRPPLYFDL